MEQALKGSMRENGFRGIGGLAQRLTSSLAPVGTGKGTGKSKGVATARAPLARLKAQWPAIVGAELARVSQPEALMANRGARGSRGVAATAGAALKLRVAGAASLEIQHRSAQLVERVNAYFGHRLIDEIRLVQGGFVPGPAPRTVPTPDPEQQARVARRVAQVKDPDLKAALERLGGRIAASRRSVLLGAVGTLTGASLFGRAPHAQQPTPEQEKMLAVRPGDHVLGKPDAPNVIIDYFSLTCPHCANFHASVLPTIRGEWIDSGKVKFVYRHFPSDSVATHASQLAECAGAARFYDTIDALFRSQVDWLTASDPEAEMMKLLQAGGLVAGNCLANDQLLDKVIDDVQSGQMLRVRGTPTLFVNGQNIGSPLGDGLAKILAQNAR
jgi:protein-disulfide isomerase